MFHEIDSVGSPLPGARALTEYEIQGSDRKGKTQECGQSLREYYNALKVSIFLLNLHEVIE
jgi:hypothetical protein